MLIYIVLTTLPAHQRSTATNWAAVVIIILYEVVFAFGWLGTCWIYGPEIAPLKYRHVAGSLGAAGEWFSTWVMVFGGGTGINAVGPKIFIWPLLCCFLAAAYVYLLCPESKSVPLHPTTYHDNLISTATGKTLEEIDALFARSPEVRERLERQIQERRQFAAGRGPSDKSGSIASHEGDKHGISRLEKI
jgi:hypothetical protein